MRKLIYIFLALSLTSCLEKEIPFEGRDAKTLLSLSATFSTDSLMTVYLAPTKSVIGKDVEIERFTGKQATVDVYQGGEFMESLVYNENIKGFVGSNKPQEGMSYTIKAKAEGLDAVVARVEIPKSVEISNVSKLVEKISDSYEDRRFSVIFNDPSAKNYYKLNVYSISGYNESDGKVVKYMKIIPFTSDDAVFKGKSDDIGDAFDAEYSNLFGVFSDEFIGESSYTIDVDLNSYDLDTYSDYFKLFVSLQSISEDYYLFLKSRELQIEQDDSPFSEPVQIWSNVEGGVGIAAAYSVSTKEIIID